MRGISTILTAFALLLILSSAYPYCPTATRSIYLAAVTGEESGGVFQLEVETRPGNGSIYTSVSPRTGFATQESEEAAADYAFSTTGVPRSGCDVLFRIKGKFGDNSVDGPSAGGAMALAARAALLNRTIRQDIVMTGTISPEGKVGEVGGIIEKGLGVSEAGGKYFLVPKPLKVYEALLLSTISRSRDFHAIEVPSIEEAERIAFSNYSEKFSSKFKPESKSAPSLAPIQMDADLARFSLVAKKVVDELDSKVQVAFPLQGESEESQALRQYFAAEISKYRSLLPMGYPFTAANSAFLLSIDAEYARIGDSKVDLDGTVKNAQQCGSSLRPSAKTQENLHWAIGSDLRRIWAKNKLNETLENRAEQGGYTTLRDVLYSYSWCEISGQLSSQADEIGGTPVDEKLLAQLASEKLSEAEEALDSAARQDYDALWHLKNGLDANRSGNYGAAIYEATYAATMQKIASGNVENLTAASEKLVDGERKTLWGKIYQGQGAYLYQDAVQSKSQPSDAYRILKYSQEIDRQAQEIDRELAKAAEEAPAPAAPDKAPEENRKQQAGQDYLVPALLGAAVALLGLMIAYRLLKRKTAGKKQ